MVGAFWKSMCVLSIIGCVVISCKVVSGGEGGSSIDELKFQNGEVSGWNEIEGDGYIPFDPSNMETLVNGGSVDFIPKGMVEGFEQNMAKDGTERTIQTWVLDYGTAEKALTMYNDRAQKYASIKESAAPLAEADAFLTPDTYGYQGFAHFGKYYVWMKFDNYGSNKSEAKSNLLEFLNVEKGKIAKQK